MTIEVQLLLSNFLQHWYLNDEVSHLKGRTTDLQNVMMQSSSLETVLGLWNQLWAKKKERAKKRVRVGLRWTVIDKSSFAAQRMIGVVLGGSSGDKNSFRTDRLQITKKKWQILWNTCSTAQKLSNTSNKSKHSDIYLSPWGFFWRVCNQWFSVCGFLGMGVQSS